MNIINDKYLDEMNEALDILEKDPLRNVIFTSSAPVFSAGLDLPYVLSLDKNGMDRFLLKFGKTMFRLATSPFPTFTAANGHAIAGGTVFAICTDERVLIQGPYRVGLVEVGIGMCFPGWISLVVRNALSRGGSFQKHVLQGNQLNPQEAVQCGMFDHAVESKEKLMPYVIERASTIKKHMFVPYRETKRFLQMPLFEESRKPGFADDLDKRFSEVWFSESTQNHLKGIVASLKK